MAKFKRHNANKEGVDRLHAYPVAEAIAMVKARANAKFDETIDASVNLGVDPRKSDQVVRGSTVLPNGTGKSVRVAVFAQGDNADKAKAAGADLIGEAEITQISRDNGRLENPLPRDDVADATFATPIYLRRTAGKARVTVFEGGHEGIALATVEWLARHQKAK